MAQMYGMYIGGEHIFTEETYPVVNKYTQDIIAEVSEASPNEANHAVSAAHSVLKNPLSVHERYQILENAANLLGERAEEIALTIARESGKPLKDAQGEVARGQQTLRFSAIAARTLKGTEIPVRANPGSEDRLAFTIRKPYGVVLAITPFNFPLNLVLHKVGPAIAAGNSVVLKPAPATPLTALKVAELLADAGLPAGWLNVVTGHAPEVGQWLVADPRVELISFTGSAGVGRAIQEAADLRPVILELGNNSANIVHSDANLHRSATILAQRAFSFAGQVCISVQRIFVHRPVLEKFQQLLVEATIALKVGNPEDVSTDIGPLINEQAAIKAEMWYREAIEGGAIALVKAERNGCVMTPGILTNVNSKMRVVCEEVFAPLAVVIPYDHFDEAILLANEGRFGLQAGVFTENLHLMLKAAQQLKVGGVIINDSSSYRADNMPYGGIKESGIGREGPEFAVLEMTYESVVVISP